MNDDELILYALAFLQSNLQDWEVFHILHGSPPEEESGITDADCENVDNRIGQLIERLRKEQYPRC